MTDPGQLACRPHWYALPPELRQRINRAWRAITRGEFEAIEDHRAAVAEAQAAWAAG